MNEKKIVSISLLILIVSFFAFHINNLTGGLIRSDSKTLQDNIVREQDFVNKNECLDPYKEINLPGNKELCIKYENAYVLNNKEEIFLENLIGAKKV